MTRNQSSAGGSSAATGAKPSLVLFSGLALIGLLKDILDLIGLGSLPVLGTAITLCFSFFSFMLLLLFDRSGGRANKRMAQGMVVTMGTLVESIGFVINFLPLQTLTAVFLYIISYKSWKNSQRTAAVIAKGQRRNLQTQQARMARAVALREERMQRQAAAATPDEPAPAAPERPAKTSRMPDFSVPQVVARPSAGAAIAVAASGSGTPVRPMRSSTPLDRSASQPVVSTQFQPANGPVRPVIADTLPIVQSEHGYGVDIGGGEIFGEYRTAEEARRAMPEAIRSRDGRQAYLKNRQSGGVQKTPTQVSTGAARTVAGGAAQAAVLAQPREAAAGVSPSLRVVAQAASIAPAQKAARLETFDARKELAGLRAIPKADRRAKLTEIKQNLSRQTEGLAQVQANVVSIIRSNPDASYESLAGEMARQGTAYGMNDRQRKTGEEVLKKYAAKHEEIRKLRGQYSDNQELFKTLFGRPPKGKIEVVDGPMTFYFKCHDVNDFALIHSQSFIDGREPTQGQVETAAQYGGTAGITTLVPGVNGSVIAENSSHYIFQKSPEQSDTVRTHEEQHVMNHLFVEQFDEARDVISRFHESGTRGEKEAAVEDYLRYFQEKAEEESRDEILAYFKDGRSFDDILTTLSLKKNEGGGYDFLVEDRDMAEHNVALLFGEEFRSFAKEKASGMYDAEYRGHLKTALQSVERLTKAGYDRDKAIALLVHEPLSRWDKAVGRILAESTPPRKASPSDLPVTGLPPSPQSGFTRLKDLSTDASARIREAGSRLSRSTYSNQPTETRRRVV